MNRKYSLNEDYFETIDSENKAYWLGFIVADGCIHKNKLYIHLKKSDNQHLELLKTCLSYSGPLYYVGNTNSVRLIIHSKKLVTDLLKLGINYNKSHTQTPIDVGEFQRHFWRGVFDGDGCISKGKKYWRLRLIGNKFIVDGFTLFLLNNELPSGSIREVKHAIGTWEHCVSGLATIYPVIKILYKSNNIALIRKNILGQKCILECETMLLEKKNSHKINKLTNDQIYKILNDSSSFTDAMKKFGYKGHDPSKVKTNLEKRKITIPF